MFYVYKLIDPRNSQPFYVGKGKLGRAWMHSKAVRAGKSSGNPKKDQRISELFAVGLEPIIRIVAEYEDQTDAFEHEIELIAITPGLLNILKGGQGWALSAEEAERRDVERRGRVSRIYLTKWLTMAEKWPFGCTVPNHRNGDAMGAEFIRIVRELVGAPSNLDAIRRVSDGPRC